MNSKAKKVLCIITSLAIGTFTPVNKTLIKTKTSTYTKGKIYIVDSVPESTLTDNPYDVFVLDERYSSNPNMRVYDSYKITSVVDQAAIIDELLEYEKEDESNWNRSKISLQIEWFLHNVLYDLGIERYRTRHVDFDNDYRKDFEEDEKEYAMKLMHRNK